MRGYTMILVYFPENTGFFFLLFVVVYASTRIKYIFSNFARFVRFLICAVLNLYTVGTIEIAMLVGLRNGDVNLSSELVLLTHI